MRIFGTFAGLLVGAILLAALGAAVYYAYQIVVALFARLEPQTATATAIISLVILAGAALIASAIRSASRNLRAVRLLSRKAATYQALLESLAARGEHGTCEQLLMLYGSAGVIKAYSQLCAAEPAEGAVLWDALIAQIRRDLGVQAPGPDLKELRGLVIVEPPRATANQ